MQRSSTASDAEALARALDHQLTDLAAAERAGRRIAGWKVGFTSRGLRDCLGPGIRPFGHITEDRIHTSGATISLRLFDQCKLEAELCFTLGERLAGEPTRSQVLGALATVSPAFEIVNARGGSPSALDLVANNLWQWGIVVGEPRPMIEPLPGSAELVRDRHLVDAAAPDIDDHVTSVARLVARLSSVGRALEVGDRVITGSYVDAVVTEPSQWMATFEGLGDVSVQFE